VLFLPPNQQHQSTEGMKEVKSSQESFIFINVLTLLGKQIGVSKALAVSG